MAEQEQPVQASAPSLWEFIRVHRSTILREWERAVRVLPCAQGLSGPRLINHIPDVLERVASVVQGVRAGERPVHDTSPEVHALDRLDAGFDLEQVAGEYALLRTCVLRLYQHHQRETGGVDAARLLEEVERLNRGFDEALATAVTRYARARERTLVALDRLSEAALGTEDLDAFLPRLLHVLVETTEAVDSVALLLREGDTLRVRAAVGLEEDVAAGFCLQVGEGLAGEIAAGRRPLEVRSAATDPRVRSPALRGRGTRALYGVPLLHGEDVIGVAHMGSRTAFEFSHEDKLLFRAMTSRATMLLVQARLVERERAAREELEEERRLLRLVVEQSGDGIAIADEHGLLRLLNAESERQHGTAFRPVSAPEWASAYSLRTLDDRPLPLEEVPLYRALQGERVEGACIKVRRSDGQVRILSCTGAPLRRPDGSLAGAVLTTRDETERLEQEARQAQTLALLDALLAGAPAAVALLDTRLRYVRVNEVLAAANGHPMEAHLGRTVSEVLGARAGALEPLLRRVLETGEPVRGFEFSGPTALKPGVQREWMGDFFPVRAPDGEALGVAGIIMDITERKRREEELRRTAEFRERFLGIVSHDLRNPLNSILLAANALLRAEDVPERHLKPVRRLVTSAERMMRMIEDLLDFTRGRLGGGLPLAPRPMNLKQLCRQVLEELEVAWPERMLRLVGEGDFSGEWDPDRMAQLLGNLGKNALDYSPERTPVDLVLCDEGATVHLSLRNRGPPIPRALLPHLFEPFQRGGQEDPRSGLGLGLFIAREVVLAHGGTIGVQSTEGRGTIFEVRLPRRVPGR